MPTEFDILLEQAIKAFEQQFNVDARPFGNVHAPVKGASDNANGVQWNIAVIRATHEIRLGVNLEGMKYKNWPITTFIKNELAQPSLMDVLVSIRQPEQVIVNFTRDAWQMASRPKIEEANLAHYGATLSNLTPEQWHEMLTDALSCLDKEKDYRARGLQVVTKSTGQVEMEVSPHLNIHSYLQYKENNIETALAHAYQNLKPIYEWVKQQAR
jgi:hypothetical protein